jgi:hypothetical protein
MPRIIPPGQIRSGIERLRRRRSEIADLDPSSVSKYDPKIDALQASLDDSFYKTFGGINDRYNRYRRTINWAAEIPSVGADISETEYRADVEKGKAETLTMLDAAIAVLEEELAESDQIEAPVRILHPLTASYLSVTGARPYGAN